MLTVYLLCKTNTQLVSAGSLCTQRGRGRGQTERQTEQTDGQPGQRHHSNMWHFSDVNKADNPEHVDATLEQNDGFVTEDMSHSQNVSNHNLRRINVPKEI